MADAPRKPAGQPPNAPFDLETGHRCDGGDMELLSEMAGLFLQECPQHVSEIQQAARDLDGDPNGGTYGHDRQLATGPGSGYKGVTLDDIPRAICARRYEMPSTRHTGRRPPFLGGG